MNQFELVFRKYLREDAVAFVIELQQKEPFNLRITKPRNSKHGDYKFHPRGKELATISVNGNLNEQAFLFTFLHEFAHHLSVLNHGHKVQAHGKEWKGNFATLLKEAISKNLFDEDISSAILGEINHLKATTMGNRAIYRLLHKNEMENSTSHIEELSPGDHFRFRDRLFVVEKKRRTRYLCTEKSSGRQFLFQGFTAIEKD